MNLRRFLLAIFIATNLSLVYIFLQVQIYDFGYRAESKKTDLQKLKDINADLSNYICKLKSANNLGGKLLSDNSHLQFLDSSHVVTLQTPLGIIGDRVSLGDHTVKVSKKSGLLSSLLSLKSQAEAEPIK